MDEMHNFATNLEAAENGDADAQLVVGIAYQLGEDGAPRDPDQATKWLNAAAEAGNAKALYVLGSRIFNEEENQGYGTCEEGIHLLTEAAEQGVGEAQFLLGSLYSSGEDVPQDIDMAIRWYTCAADGGNSDAQYNLGVIYQSDDWHRKDEQKAAVWMERAANQGNVLAQRQTAVNYLMGTGVKEDTAKCKYWLEKAAAQGDEKAIAALKQYFGGKYVPDMIDQKLSIKRQGNLERKVIVIYEDNDEWVGYEQQWGWNVEKVERIHPEYCGNCLRITLSRNTQMKHYDEIRQLEWQHRINERKHTPRKDVTFDANLVSYSHNQPSIFGTVAWGAAGVVVTSIVGELLGSIAIIPLLITAGIVLVRVKNYRTAEKEWNKWVESIDLPYPEDKMGEEELENLVIKAQALLNDGLL